MPDIKFTIFFPRSKTALLSYLTFVLLFQCHITKAYDWDSKYGANLSTGYSDNFRLSESDKINTSSSTLSISANLDGNTETSSLGIALAANGNSYSESDIDENTGHSLLFSASKRDERISTSLGLSINSQSTTDTELLDTGGIIDGSRDTNSIFPGISFQFSERNSVSANLNLTDVSYDTVSLVEYTDNSVSLSWIHQIDEASEVSVSMRASNYEPEIGGDTDTDGIDFGYNLKVSERLNYGVSVGHTRVERPDDSEDGNDFALEVNYQSTERSSFAAVLSNSYQASGAGNVRDEDRLSLQWSHKLSDRTSLNLSADAVGTDDRDYYSVQLGSKYQYAKQINLGASIRYREQDTESSSAEASAVFLSISYSSL